jgi:hypothetical protein
MRVALPGDGPESIGQRAGVGIISDSGRSAVRVSQTAVGSPDSGNRVADSK